MPMPFEIMKFDVTKSVSKEFKQGLLYSFAIFLPTFLLVFFVGTLSAYLFLLINTIVFFLSQDTGHKKGVLFGYGFLIVICIVIFFMYLPSLLSASNLNDAVQYGDVSLCLKAEKRYLINSCMINVALQQNDVSMCDQIDQKNDEGVLAKENNHSRYYCYLSLAKRLEDPLICKKIGDDNAFIKRIRCFDEVLRSKPANAENIDFYKKYCPDLSTESQDLKNTCSFISQ